MADGRVSKLNIAHTDEEINDLMDEVRTHSYGDWLFGDTDDHPYPDE